MYFEKLQAKTGKLIKDIFPNFDLFIYGGVNFDPYRQSFEKVIGKKMDRVELYPASEGFIAYQDSQSDKGIKYPFSSFFTFFLKVLGSYINLYNTIPPSKKDLPSFLILHLLNELLL